jgi:polyisoprenoid-binding protein YceI
MRKLTLAPLPLLLMVAALPMTALADVWQIDPAHSTVGFSIRHLMITNVKGVFHGVSGTIDYDGKEAGKASVQATILTSTVDTGIAGRDDHLRNPDFFDAEKFPQITFQSTKVMATGEKTALIAGNLTLHGVTRPVTLDAELLGTVKDAQFGSRMGFTATAVLNRKDFGLTWNKVLDAGGFALGDEVKVSLEIEALEASEVKPAKAAAGAGKPARAPRKTK